VYENGKIRHDETNLVMGEGRLKRMMERCYIVRIFVNVTMYPQYNN
jgi:hypothetical protein